MAVTSRMPPVLLWVIVNVDICLECVEKFSLCFLYFFSKGEPTKQEKMKKRAEGNVRDRPVHDSVEPLWKARTSMSLSAEEARYFAYVSFTEQTSVG